MGKNLLSFMAMVFVLILSASGFAAPYYQGKTITIIVGTNPGGGYDNTARLVARYLPRYLPGKPTVIIQNMPGAGHIIAANYLFNIAKPDGLTIGTFNRGLPFAQLSKTKGIKFDLRKFVWIGSLSVDPTALFIRTDLPYKNAEELRKAKEPIICASEGLGTTGYQFPVLLKEFGGFNFKIITYLSGSDSRLALEKKEADARASSYSSTKPMVDRGILKPVIRGEITIPELKHLPVDQEFAQDKKGKTIMAMLSSVDLMSRPYVFPPKTPENLANLMREAFQKMAKDPALQEEGKKMFMTIKYASATECLKVVNFNLNQPEDIVSEFTKYVGF